MDQITGTTSTVTPEQPQDDSQAAVTVGSGEPSGFGSRGRARRRARFLRKARELAYRDLGGLVFNLHRFGQRNDALVLAKLGTLGHIDAELRSIEAVLGEREPVTVLREAGITACPRCAAIHSSEDRFCPHCGLPMSRHVDLPVAGASAAATPPPQNPALPATPEPAPATAPAPARTVEAFPPAPATPPSGVAAPVPAQQPPGRSPTSPSSQHGVPTTGPPANSGSAVQEATEIIRPGPPGS